MCGQEVQVIYIAFLASCPHTLSLSCQIKTVALYQCLHSQFKVSQSKDKVWRVDMCVGLYIIPCFTCIGNVAISVAFWASCPHTLSLSRKIRTVVLY